MTSDDGHRAADAEPVPAREVPAWRPEEGPISTHSWPPGRGPVLEVYVEGAWRRAEVRQRQDRAVFVAVQVEISLPSVGATTICTRTYAWDSQAMRVLDDAPEA